MEKKRITRDSPPPKKKHSFNLLCFRFVYFFEESSWISISICKESKHNKGVRWSCGRNCVTSRMYYHILILAQNNSIKTNYIQAKINSKCMFCGDRDESFNHTINECSKPAQKEYKISTTLWERWSTRNCARNFRFFHTNKS